MRKGSLPQLAIKFHSFALVSDGDFTLQVSFILYPWGQRVSCCRRQCFIHFAHVSDEPFVLLVLTSSLPATLAIPRIHIRRRADHVLPTILPG